MGSNPLPKGVHRAMVDFVVIAQGIVGGLLFFLSGYLVSLAFFKEGDVDAVERAVYSITFSILVPSLVCSCSTSSSAYPFFPPQAFTRFSSD